MPRVRAEPQVCACHLGRSLNRNLRRLWPLGKGLEERVPSLQRLRWVCAPVSPAPGGPQRLQTDPPSHPPLGRRHADGPSLRGGHPGRRWRLWPHGWVLAGFPLLPPKLQDVQYDAAPCSVTSGLQALPKLARDPRDCDMSHCAGQKPGVWPPYKFTNSAWGRRCKNDTPKAPLFQRPYNFFQSKVGKAS